MKKILKKIYKSFLTVMSLFGLFYISIFLFVFIHGQCPIRAVDLGLMGLIMLLLAKDALKEILNNHGEFKDER